MGRISAYFMGPEGGDGGGTVIAVGPPEKIAATAGSHTGEYLKPRLEGDVTAKQKIA